MSLPASCLDPHARPLPLAVLRLSGSQAEMGAQHGRLLRDLGGFDRTLAYYPGMIEGMLRGCQVGTVERALPGLLRPLIDRLVRRLDADRPAALKARSIAGARAVGVDVDEARWIVAMDVFQNMVGLAGRLGLGPFTDGWARRAAPACSTLAAWGPVSEDGRLLHARNFDFPGVGVWDHAPSLVFCSPDDGLRYGYCAARGADAPGVTCFNEAGLSLTAHTRLHREVAFRGWAIVDLGHEIVRRAKTLAQAVAIAAERPVASTWGLLVSSAAERRAVLIETTAGGVRVTEPGEDEPWLGCTNHYRHRDLQVGELAPTPGWSWHTHSRLHRLHQAAREALQGQGLDAVTLRGLLGDRIDCDAGCERLAGGVLAQSTGVQSVVIDPERQAIEVSVGACPSGRGAFQRIDWRWAATPEAEEVAIAGDVAHVRPTRYDDGPAAEAARHYLRAAQLEAQGGNPDDCGEHLRTAWRLDPDDPTLCLLAGAVELRRGEFATALALFQRGARAEPSTFPKGRLLLWAARAAEASGEPNLAKQHRHSLHGLAHPLLGRIQASARQDERKPPDRKALRSVQLHVLLGDIG